MGATQDTERGPSDRRRNQHTQMWSCEECTFKQPATSKRCSMCQNPNPFMIHSQQQSSSSRGHGNYYQRPQSRQLRAQPVAKESLKYQSKPRKDNEFGKIIFQTNRITKQQVLDTYAIYLINSDIKTSSWPLYVFGDNDIDKTRANGTERDMMGGLAGVLGIYDKTVSFGVTTTFYRNRYVNNDFNAFKKIIDDDFDKLLKYIKYGHDIIVPSPNMQDLYGKYQKNYWKIVDNEKKQVIFHNLGTGLAMIPFNYIEYIQKKVDILKEIGDTNTLPEKKQAQDETLSLSNKYNEYLICGFIRESFDYDIPENVQNLCMDYLEYMVEKWDSNNVSSNIEINGNIVSGKQSIEGFQKVYGILDIKDYPLYILKWKLKIINVKWKSIGAYANIGIGEYNYCGYSGEHIVKRGSTKYEQCIPYGGKLTIGDTIEVVCNLEKKQISFIVNDQDLGIAYNEINIESNNKLCVSLKYPETEVQFLGIEMR